MNDETLQHFGVKGMKWGKRKSDRQSLQVTGTNDTVRTPSKTRGLANAFQGTPLALPVGLAVGTRNAVAMSKNKKKILAAFDAKPGDFKRKDLRDAASIVQEFSNVKIKSSDGKEIQMSENLEALDDILQHFGVKGMRWGVRRAGGSSRKGLLVDKKTPKRSNEGDSRKGLLVTKTKPTRSNGGSSRKGLVTTKTKLEGKPGTVTRKGLVVNKTKKKRISNEEYHSKRKGKVMSFYNADYEQNRRGGLSHEKSMAYARVTSKVSKTMALAPAAVGVAGLAAQAGWKAYDVATSPNVVRAGKNIVLAAKRSPIRVVDGSAMTNVIKANLQNRISQWGDDLDGLQHFGVKGMKWGVRKAGKRLQKGIKNQIKKSNARDRQHLDKFHDKKLKSRSGKAYKKTYDKTLPKMKNSHYATVRKIRGKEMEVKRARATLVATVVAPAAIRTGKSLARAGYNKATSPEAVRAGKNIILAAKRSSVRVVDGSAMDNVINQSFINRTSQGVNDLDDIMLHFGVKGMKWGVRKGVNNFNNDPKVQAMKTYVKESSKSRVRERAWAKVDTRGLSTDQIYQLAARAQLENDFKRLGKAQGVSGRAYRNRDQLSTEQLSSQVNNLRAKEAFKKQAREANREQRERAKAIVTVGGPILVRFALTRTVSIKDVAKQINKLPKKEYKPMEANTVLGESLLGLTKSTSTAFTNRNSMDD